MMQQGLVGLQEKFENENEAISASLKNYQVDTENSLEQVFSRIEEGELYSSDTREKMIKALVGLKGHLLANTVSLLSYQEDYSEHDKARLEYHLEVKMYEEIRGFIEETAPHFVDVIDELKSAAASNLDLLTHKDFYTDLAASQYEAAQSSSTPQQYCIAGKPESEDDELIFDGSCAVIDLTAMGTQSELSGSLE